MYVKLPYMYIYLNVYTVVYIIRVQSIGVFGNVDTFYLMKTAF